MKVSDRGKPVDKRADIWAFGVVLYEMLAADRVFGGETVPDILAAVLTWEIDLSKVPERVRPMLAACLGRDPKKRLRDIGDVWRLLDVAPAAAQAPVVVEKKAPLLWPIQGAHFSPDGRYMAYIRSQGAKREIYVQEVKVDGSGAGIWMVSAGAVGMPRWRADGKELTYLAPDSNIMAVDVSLLPVFHAGQPHPLFQLPTCFLRTRPDAGAIADATPDLQRFLFAMPEGGGQDSLTVVLNWDSHR